MLKTKADVISKSLGNLSLQQEVWLVEVVAKAKGTNVGVEAVEGVVHATHAKHVMVGLVQVVDSCF